MSPMTRFTWVRIGGIYTPKTGSRYVGLAHPQGGSGYVGFGTAKLGLSVWDGTDYSKIRKNKFEGTCPRAMDGAVTDYVFYTDHGIERVEGCETKIDPNHPLFRKVLEILNRK